MSDNPSRVQMYLPNESWLDIFACVPRRRLGLQVAMASRHFSEVADLWLYDKCGPVTLKPLTFRSGPGPQQAEKAEQGGAAVASATLLENFWHESVPFPTGVDKPANIVDFEALHFEYSRDQLDTQVLGMLAQMRPLLATINLRWPHSAMHHDPRCFSILRQLGQLGSNVRSIQCLIYEPEFHNEFAPLLRQLRSISFFCSNLTPAHIGFLANWLTDGNYAQRQAGPRHLALQVPLNVAQAMVAHLRGQFHSATVPTVVSYVVHFQMRWIALAELPIFEERNVHTGGLLRLERVDPIRFRLICCCTPEAGNLNNQQKRDLLDRIGIKAEEAVQPKKRLIVL